MSNFIRFSCTALPAGKAGVISKDSDGCYEMVVGGLNVYNSAGQFYVAEGARELFHKSSHFMRRVQRGVLKGELGHPKMTPGMSYEQFASRIMHIYEDNVCCVHQDIWLDFDRVRDENGKPVIAIMSKIRPSGPHGDALAKSLESSGENVCFSIRSFTDDFTEHGIQKRLLRQVVTFDQVTEPGIKYATKFGSPGLEELEVVQFSRGQLERGMQLQTAGIGNESSTMSAGELFRSLGWNISPSDRPAFMQW